MFDRLQEIKGRDARDVRQMAESAGCSPEAMLAGIVRAYLALARGAPEALPQDPLARQARAAVSKGIS